MILAQRNLALTSLIVTLWFGACTESVVNDTSSLGGQSAGDRGIVSVLFINNVPYRAVFTVGTYDSLDQESEPDFAQFGLDENGTALAGNQSSPIGTLQCGRVFAIGSPQLLQLIRANIDEAAFDDELLVDGIAFFSEPAGSEESDGLLLEGMAPAFEALLGVDVPCNALLIVRLERDDLGPAAFRVDFELIPSRSDR